jgi:hypothetical protein
MIKLMRKRKRKRKLKSIAGVADIDHQLDLSQHDPVQRAERMAAPASAYPQWMLDLLADLPNMTELEAVDAMLQLQKLVAGDAALLNNPDMSPNVAKLREAAAHRDRVKEEFETDRVKFIEETLYQADQITPTGAEAERVKVRGQQMMQQAIKDAKNKKSAKAKYLDMLIDTGPKETIYVAPRTVRTSKGTVILATQLKVGHRKFLLQPGENHVPFLVAQQYKESQVAEREQRLRDHAYKSTGHLGQIEKKMQEIDAEFGTSHEVDPRVRQMVTQQNTLMP